MVALDPDQVRPAMHLATVPNQRCECGIARQQRRERIAVPGERGGQCAHDIGEPTGLDERIGFGREREDGGHEALFRREREGAAHRAAEG